MHIQNDKNIKYLNVLQDELSWCCETLAKYPGFIPHVTWGPLLIGEKHTSTRETWDKKYCNQLIGSNRGINCKGNVKLKFVFTNLLLFISKDSIVLTY